MSSRTVYVSAREVRASLRESLWPDWLTTGLRTDVLCEYAYDRRGLGFPDGHVVRLAGTGFTVKHVRHGVPPTRRAASR